MGNLKPGTLNNDTRLMALPHKKPAVAETGSTYNTIQTGKEGRWAPCILRALNYNTDSTSG